MNLNLHENASRLICTLKGDQRFSFFDQVLPRLSWSREMIDDYQKKKILNLLLWSYETIDAYNVIFNDLGILPDQLDFPSQFSRLPILKREMLQRNLGDYTSKKISPKLRKLVMTGGTTGDPVKVWWDLKGFQEATAIQYRTYHIVGAGFGKKWLKIVGGLRHIRENKGLKSKLQNILANRQSILAFDLNEQSIKQWINQINQYKPDVIFGYGGHILLLGEYLKKHPTRLNAKVILFGGEALPNHHSYESVFNCKVVQTYATREIGVIAYECSQGNMHIAEDNVYVEVAEHENQQRSKLLITSLHNRATPLIRYEIGDIGQILPSDCSCGSSFHMLSLDIGRVPQYITLANSRTVTHLFFIHVIKDFPIIKYQFVIREKRKILLMFLPQTHSDISTWGQELKSRILTQLGQDIEFEMQSSQEWIVSSTGKILPVIDIT